MDGLPNGEGSARGSGRPLVQDPLLEGVGGGGHGEGKGRRRKEEEEEDLQAKTINVYFSILYTTQVTKTNIASTHGRRKGIQIGHVQGLIPYTLLPV